MGCVGNSLSCTERQVSICAKDSRGPYHYDLVTSLVKTARDMGLAYAVDVYPHYGSDADVALTAGYDVRHGLIGAGVYASHGYERSHVEGMKKYLFTAERISWITPNLRFSVRLLHKELRYALIPAEYVHQYDGQDRGYTLKNYFCQKAYAVGLRLS